MNFKMSPNALASVLLEMLNNAPCIEEPNEYQSFFPRRHSLARADLHRALSRTDVLDIDAALDVLVSNGSVKRFCGKIHRNGGGWAHYFVPTDKAHLLKDSGRTRGL